VLALQQRGFVNFAIRFDAEMRVYTYSRNVSQRQCQEDLINAMNMMVLFLFRRQLRITGENVIATSWPWLTLKILISPIWYAIFYFLGKCVITTLLLFSYYFCRQFLTYPLKFKRHENSSNFIRGPIETLISFSDHITENLLYLERW
jgi:hypothetical protein